MAKGTTFGTIHSNRDLLLIQQSVEVGPATPKINLVDIPGADGSKDLTEALGVGVKFNDRILKWVFALYPGDPWASAFSAVSNALNGLRCEITLDDDPDYVYTGRLSVTETKRDRLLNQITVEAVCQPYKMKPSETVVENTSVTTTSKHIKCVNDRKPVVPTITVSHETNINFKGTRYTVNPGVHKILDIEFVEGANDLIVSCPSLAAGERGSITVAYREGAL